MGVDEKRERERGRQAGRVDLGVDEGARVDEREGSERGDDLRGHRGVTQGA